jgi:hypothetical protein
MASYLKTGGHDPIYWPVISANALIQFQMSTEKVGNGLPISLGSNVNWRLQMPKPRFLPGCSQRFRVPVGWWTFARF